MEVFCSFSFFYQRTAKQEQHRPKFLSAVIPKACAQVSLCGRKVVGKYLLSLVSKPQISALARGLCWMRKKQSGVADEGRKQWAAVQMKHRFLTHDFFNVTNEKRQRWKMERNKHHQTDWASCLIWQFEGWYHNRPVITQESSVSKKENQPFPSPFLPSIFIFLIQGVQLPLCNISEAKFRSNFFLIQLLCRLHSASETSWGNFYSQLNLKKDSIDL